MEQIKTAIETMFPMNATLLGEGYDNRLEYLKHLLDLEVIEIPSGTEFSTWTVPKEWIVKDAWIKYKGKKIVDYKQNPLSLLVYSQPFQGTITKEELLKNVYSTNDFGEIDKDTVPYKTAFYDDKWGFCMSPNQVESLKDGDYEVFIDTEFKDGIMKLGVHTIKGETDKEILLFAHLDHPYQANDNLSGVGALLDVASRVKSKHTIKIVFCPETIGSIAYAHTQDLSKVEFVVAIDICGNDAPLLALKAYDKDALINHILHCALQMAGKMYKKASFRATIGSDETVFNDPDIGIPSVCLTRHPYDEYHTDQDTPDKINYERIKETADLIISIIDIADRNYIPVKNFKGQLMRSRYGIQSTIKQVNLNLDYLFYSIDGKRSVAELCAYYELSFNIIFDIFEKIIKDEKIKKRN